MSRNRPANGGSEPNPEPQTTDAVSVYGTYGAQAINPVLVPPPPVWSGKDIIAFLTAKAAGYNAATTHDLRDKGLELISNGTEPAPLPSGYMDAQQNPVTRVHSGRSSARRLRRRRSEASRKDRYAMAVESLDALLHTGLVRKKRLAEIRERFDALCKHNGIEFALRDLKEVSARSRSDFILRGHGEEDAQLSYLGRSLPKGTQLQAHEALLLHRQDLLSEFRTDPQILERARKFSEKWARRFLVGANRMAPVGMPNNSSCSEATVKDGGLLGFSIGLGRHELAHELASEKMRGFPPQDSEAVSADLSLPAHGIDLLRAGKALPSYPVALCERGLKIRVITKSSAPLHFVGHPVRKRLMDGLRKDRSCALALSGLDDGRFFSHFDGAVLNSTVSSDLSRASDLLPLDLISAIIDGLERSGKVPDYEIQALRVVAGPQIVDWGFGPELTKRGILMGLPCTWSMLSLVHLFWWTDAIRGYCRETKSSVSGAFSHNRFAICGDDAVFVGYKSVAAKYEQLMEACGAKVSPGKHFKIESDVNDIRQSRCVFLERLYTLVSDRTGKVTSLLCSRSCSIPLRGLVRPENPPMFDNMGRDLSTTKVLRYLFAIDSLWASNPLSERTLAHFCSKNRWLRDAAAKVGLTNGLPIRQGGSGLPVVTLSTEAKLQRYRVITAGEDFRAPSLLRGEVDPNWQLASMLAESDISMFYSDGTFVLLPEGEGPPEPTDAPYVLAGDPRELLKSATAESYQALVFGQGILRGYRPKVSEATLARTVRSWLESLPPVPDGVDLRVPPVAPKRVLLWIRRTWSPDGQLLFPRWVGGTKASEATVRATLFRELLDRSGGFPTDWQSQALGSRSTG